MSKSLDKDTKKEKNKKKVVKKGILNEEEKLMHKLEHIEFELANLGLREYIDYLYSPKHIIWNNLMAGIFKGFGLVLGATVVVALVTLIMSFLTGVPIIGEVVSWIQDSIGGRGI